MNLLRSCVFLGLIGFSGFVQGQQIRVADLSGSYLNHSYAYFNPSSISTISNNGNASFFHKQGIGAFSVFSQNYVNVNYLFGGDSIHNNGIGIRMINDRACAYIAVNRISLMYAHSIRLTSEYSLHFGIAPTIISYRKEAQSFGGVANSGNLDAGLWLKSNSLDLGFSANQLIPSKIQVIEEVDSIRAQYVVNGRYKSRLNYNFDLDFQFLYSINVQSSNHEMVGAVLTYLNKTRVGINYEFSRNVVFVLGVKELRFSERMGSMSLDFAYAFPSIAKDVYRPRSTIEVILNYNF